MAKRTTTKARKQPPIPVAEQQPTITEEQQPTITEEQQPTTAEEQQPTTTEKQPMTNEEQRQIFAERCAEYRGRFQGLILLGTKQPITATLLIHGLQPERVAFLLSAETRGEEFPQKVATELGCSGDGWLIPDGNYETVGEVYRGMKQIRETWHDLADDVILADVTGGLTTMSVGLAKAAHVLRLKTCYVRSEYEKNRPKPGTQEFELLPDPYVVFGDLEAKEAERLFVGHDYAGAERIFDNLRSRVDNSDYGVYADLSAAYAAWDIFNWGEAEAKLGDVLSAPLPQNLREYRGRLEQQQVILRQLQADEQNWKNDRQSMKLLQNIDRVLPLLGTLYANAQRREAQQRYDVAALFHYRCLELLSQQRLALWGISVRKANFNVDSIPPNKKTQLEARFIPLHRSRNHSLKLGLYNGYECLEILEDELVCDYDIKQIERRTQARNQSMLAHGFRLITKNEYDQFRDVAHEMIDRFFVVAKQDRTEWSDTYQFVCPFVV